MESHNQLSKLMKVSRFFPSSFTSCHFRTLPDVAESSITLAKPNKILHENDLSSNKPQQLLASASAYTSARASKLKPKKLMDKNVDVDQDRCTSKKYSSSMLFNQSSSSNSAWFTDEDGGGGGGDGDTFFSLSSNSGDSFRLKTSRRFRRCEEMKSIDEMGRRSFSSVCSYDTVPSKCRSRQRKPTAAVKTAGGEKCGEICQENEMGSDHLATQVYYSSGKGGSGRMGRRRRTAKNGRKTRKRASRRVFYGGACGMEEGYAEEKVSGDPRGDFRASMVEMIVEKRIFGAEGLQRLLKCFLELNDVAYHGMIFDVFNEICETLFSN